MVSYSVFIVLLVISLFNRRGECLQCYECSTRIGFGNYDPCSSGQTSYLRKVECLGPSVCATYMLTSEAQGYPITTTVTRGCQAIRYGATCEDIFNDLRRRGSVFPGHHECSTCSTDLCNSSYRAQLSIFIVFITVIFLLISSGL